MHRIREIAVRVVLSSLSAAVFSPSPLAEARAYSSGSGRGGPPDASSSIANTSAPAPWNTAASFHPCVDETKYARDSAC